MRLTEPTLHADRLLVLLRQVVGTPHVLVAPHATAPYTKGYRFGSGKVRAVIRPRTLVEFWRVAELCVAADQIMIVQAANTGLTGGSTPDGENYDRPVILINTRRLRGIHLLGGGRQVICLPGTTLHKLETVLARHGREPHSVIGSSCIGASVLGGISNNSGGALVQRGPAYTEMALFGRVTADGRLELVNRLGIRLDADPVKALARLESGALSKEEIEWTDARGHDDGYVTHVRDVEADTPARYNQDSARWFDASGCAGKLIVFAVRVDTFPAEKNSQVFYIGTNSTNALESLRRHLLTAYDELPIAGEYMHRDAFRIAEIYGRDTVALIRYAGTRSIPRLFAAKAWLDDLFSGSRFLPPHLTDRIMQKLGRLLPNQIPAKMHAFEKRFEHHLMLRVSRSLAEKLQAYFATLSAGQVGDKDAFDWFACTDDEGKRAFLHRFAAAGAALRCRNVLGKEAGEIVALDIALRRNDEAWFETLPEAIEKRIEHKLYYGHFLCHVMHQDYVLKPGESAEDVEHEMLKLLDARGARYPAEHNLGHLYEAGAEILSHYRDLDPCNCLNPGIGKSTRKRNWKAEEV
ncbi:D-lactate dehydrogenase [Asaia siamensis]|uniref:Quinone-dependent D-lactate dehydrogenase n=1 Tax=Asaia siamensis TaxID=110479 RepID=A0ABQ1LRQ6_9PROT|nr:D-lactate dehydrogenase [Asaia siamensis]GBR04209.1 D-lactate dehydrogenase [Asaia siamensis NRIC 0323]GGC28573.1 D-lactate dehydrogenase [Asaia siamensis]